MQQAVRESVSSYHAFINEITEMVKVMMGEEFSVRIFKVTKNNSLELDSIVILKKGKNFAPNIYLLPYFEAYLKGADLKELADKLCATYRNNSIPAVKENFTYTYEEVKSYIIYRLVSYDRNKKLLTKVPHIRYLDMAITFHCLVREDDDGIGTIRITNEHMQMWDTSIQKLRELAIENTQKLFPPVIKSMDEVILGMLKDEFKEDANEEDLTRKLLEQNCYTEDNSYNHKMFILSNQKGINGATCLLYDNVLKEFANKLNVDFFILPSSIHEVILVPYDKTITKETLAEMVKDVNLTQVARDEILSDQVYFYSRKSDKLSL